jgi:hypothetical protein
MSRRVRSAGAIAPQRYAHAVHITYLAHTEAEEIAARLFSADAARMEAVRAKRALRKPSAPRRFSWEEGQ